MRAAVLCLLFAACLPHRTLIVEVEHAGQPVPGATVAATCKPSGSAAQLTGDSGVASLAIHDHADRCTITASHESGTAQREDVGTCAANATCPVVTVELP